MTTSISQETIVSDIWKNFYDRLKAQVTSVTLTDASTTTVQNYVSSFPDQLIDSKSDYPILVVNDPEVPTEALTITKSKVIGTIELEIYTTNAESASKFISKIMYAVETYKGYLAKVGIREIEVTDNAQDSAKRDAIKIHNRSVTFSFTYFYNKTGGF